MYIKPKGEETMKKTLAIMLALIMVLALVPSVAFAEGEVAWIGETGYATLEAAVTAAKSGETITLGEGKYTLYNIPSDNTTKGKNLTFVGKGVEKTTWIIGAEVPDPNKSGTEYNSDYSFSGASVTFKDMTLNSYYNKEDINKSGSENYLGFAHTVNTLVDSCVINGVTAYWGYTSAAFRNTTFNAPVGGYALWSYSSAIMTFDNCTFNSSGKVINVYNEGYTPNVTVNFNNCTVTSTNLESLSVMNINDALVKSFTINFNGKNTINGIKADGIKVTDGSHASDAKDTTTGTTVKKTSAQATCSKLFEFNMKYGNGNNKRTTVKIDGKTVWTGGRMVRHAIDTQNDKYTDGYKDNAFTVEPNGPGSFEVTCDYCGYTETSTGKLYNDIGLTRTVRQNKNSNPVPEDAANSNKYKVANSSDITVDYTATMDMENLRWQVAGKDVEEIQKKLVELEELEESKVQSPWELLKTLAAAGRIDSQTEVILNFNFDDKIDLAAFKAKYEAAVTAGTSANVLNLTSDMFEIAADGVAFDTPNHKMTITCNWKDEAKTDDPIITLNGYGLPVKNNWNGSTTIDIANKGCVSGTVSISPKPQIAMVEVSNMPETNAQPEIFPTIQIPIVGGCKTDEFTLYYGGGSSGDSGHSHYTPTPTPVPVIVIPPKTGDMTVWQSILHFLGIK